MAFIKILFFTSLVLAVIAIRCIWSTWVIRNQYVWIGRRQSFWFGGKRELYGEEAVRYGKRDLFFCKIAAGVTIGVAIIAVAINVLWLVHSIVEKPSETTQVSADFSTGDWPLKLPGRDLY